MLRLQTVWSAHCENEVELDLTGAPYTGASHVLYALRSMAQLEGFLREEAEANTKELCFSFLQAITEVSPRSWQARGIDPSHIPCPRIRVRTSPLAARACPLQMAACFEQCQADCSRHLPVDRTARALASHMQWDLL